MKKLGSLTITTSLFLFATQQISLATDYDPYTPPATSVAGAGGDNSAEVNLAIRNSGKLSEDSKHVNVVYKNGAIIITGTVKNDRDREEIGTIAEKCGCVNVRNEVTLLDAGKTTTTAKPAPQAEIITRKGVKKY